MLQGGTCGPYVERCKDGGQGVKQGKRSTWEWNFHLIQFFSLPLATKTNPCCLLSTDEKETLQFNTNHDSTTATHMADMIIVQNMQYINFWLISWDHWYHIILFSPLCGFKEYCDYNSIVQQLCMLCLIEQLKYTMMCQAKPNKHSSKPHHHGF